MEKFLAGLNVKKASGPDNIPCKILKELAAELAPILTTIFQQSLETGQIPLDWTLAFVSLIFKKGEQKPPCELPTSFSHQCSLQNYGAFNL